MDESRIKLYALRKTDAGNRTERAQTGGWGAGPGNHVSNTLNGYNAAQDRMAEHMDTKFGSFFADKQKARRAAKRARRAAMGLR